MMWFNNLQSSFVALFTAYVSLSFTNFKSCNTHVVLTFPPARPFASDFLSNAQTSNPCGMPRITDGRPLPLLGGAYYNFTWNSAYPHHGGVRIELLNQKYELVQILIPNDFEQQIPSTSAITPDNLRFSNVSNPTITIREVLLPRNLCKNCVIRLVREAAEWFINKTTSSEYLFHSCADVDIQDQVSKREMCNNHGTFDHATLGCDCDDLYSGDSCQHLNECFDDGDCNFTGQCLSVGTEQSDSLHFHQLQCFCAPGFFGLNCEQRSSLNVTEIMSAVAVSNTHRNRRYQTKNLAAGFDVFWRILTSEETTSGQAQIEMIVQATTNSWIAIGFRSGDATPTCKDFPLPSPTPATTNSTATCGVSANTSIYSAPNFNVTLTVINSTDVNRTSCHPPTPAQSFTNSSSPDVFLHPMDCTDIIWAAVKQQNFSRIRDMYTRDRSTPQNDEFYGGLQTLTAATAFETGNNVTTLIFRRLLSSSHPTDATIDGEMHVTFARGQNPNLPIHQPPSGLERLSVDSQHDLIFNFYHEDELKYHGTDSNQRGFTKINFSSPRDEKLAVGPSDNITTNAAVARAISSAQSTATTLARQQLQPCFGQYRSPSMCSPDVKQLNDGIPTCQYAAEWFYDESLQNGSLRVSIFTSQPKRWLGIGWSKTGQMINSTIFTAWVGSKDQRPTVTQRFSTGLFMPAKHGTQNVMILGGRRSGDRAMAVEFAKPLRTSNASTDVDLTYNGCYFLLFPVDGGEYNEQDESILKHTTTPIVSQEKVCFNHCTVAKVLPAIPANNNSNNQAAIAG